MGGHQKILQEATEEHPLLPSAAQFVWAYFLRLNQTRQ